MVARLLSQRSGPARPRALVVGAGIAGLLAARVLADGFSEVEIVEQDALPTRPGPRPGVPQGHHVHGLTARGAQVMEQFFPGLHDELTEAGAPGGDFGQIVAFRFPTCWSPRATTGIPLQTFSRPLLEARLRERVLGLRNVRVRSGVRVTGLTGGPGRVTGVRTRDTGTVLAADLVVDASGRASRLPGWLTELGLPAVASTVVDAHVGYASRLYAAPDPHAPPWAAAMELVQAPHVRRGFMATRVEDGRLLVTLQGADDDHPPHDPDGFTAFAQSLRTPLAGLLAHLTPLSAVRRYAHCANRRTHYHRLPVWPDGLIALGDSVCAFNPLYGQGMGVAAMEAELLHTMLARLPAGPGHGFTRSYQQRVAALTRRPWIMSTVQDRGWHLGPAADRSTRVTNAVLTTVQRTMSTDPDVFRRFLAAMHMTESSAVLLHPRAVLAVASTALRPGSAPDDARLWWGHPDPRRPD
ncbi:FAD-dependent oxidoreductase [Streptomyces sp. NPDC056161]|uniref:FAD-dependent oxidoreductase n=1 Tax=Streptomyces sp. NPDC056161 TaxID=3345732 RepID=UPI0035D90936